MGSGLSGLQRCILQLAVRVRACRTADWETKEMGVPDVLRAEVMMHHYGFQPSNDHRPPDGKGALTVHLRGWKGYKYTGQVFSVPEIGQRRYNVARAAIARTTRRLQSRGLVDKNALYGIILTPEGWREAERLACRQMTTS